MGPGPPSQAVSLKTNQTMPTPKNRSTKRRRASSLASTQSTQHTSAELIALSIADNDQPSNRLPATAPGLPFSPAVKAFDKAIIEADKARKLSQQTSRLLFQKVDAFILELKQLDTTGYPEITQATSQIQQFVINTAQTLANGNTTNSTSDRTEPLKAVKPTPLKTTQSENPTNQSPATNIPKVSWASIAAGNITASQPTLLQGKQVTQSTTPNTDPQSTAQHTIDNWLFIRLSPDHNLCQLHPHHIQQFLSPSLSGAHLSSIHVTPSGLALKPSTPDNATILQTKKEQIKTLCGASAVETADPWVKLRLPHTPRWLNTLEGCKVVSIEEVSSEVTQAFKARPVQTCWGISYKDSQSRDNCPLLIDFRKADLPSPPPTIQLFFTQLVVQARIIIRRPTQCRRCWAFHRPETCSRSSRCMYCAATSHTTEQHQQITAESTDCGAAAGQCMCPYLCANCHGPHEATHEQCPLRPNPSNPRKTQKEIKNSCQVGRAQRVAVNQCWPTTPPPSQLDIHPNA